MAPHTEVGEQREGEGASETMHIEQAAIPIPRGPVLPLGEEREELGVKLSLRRREKGWFCLWWRVFSSQKLLWCCTLAV